LDDSSHPAENGKSTEAECYGYAKNIVLMRHKSNFFIGFISQAAPQEGVRVLEK
jgi:hypothetical protein